ncbi:hypothetical protein M0208_04375 [Sphingomonas sp. SUN019]|uniref:hypothetical protein n=1 Tax=Sphingomonas sp. SUN019 TaxID=2937788 RepID=UPI002164B928|nr:hypothetical protein [Sphingomonas sp. SUN019]UVO49788.1 hypothetical protein M0208_04375 [Sphingomonas sp. SUN019]
MSDFRRPAPPWFRIVAIILILWGLIGCWFWYTQFRYGAESWGPDITDWDRAFYAALPGWYNAVYFVAVASGAAGAVALLLRSGLAVSLFVVSLVAVIVMFGWTFVATDLIAHKGLLVATGFPVFIAVVAAYQVWLARSAKARGWIA